MWLSRPGARCRIALGPFPQAARRGTFTMLNSSIPSAWGRSHRPLGPACLRRTSFQFQRCSFVCQRITCARQSSPGPPRAAPPPGPGQTGADTTSTRPELATTGEDRPYMTKFCCSTRPSGRTQSRRLIARQSSTLGRLWVGFRSVRVVCVHLPVRVIAWCWLVAGR